MAQHVDVSPYRKPAERLDQNPDWWEIFFDPLYGDLILDRDSNPSLSQTAEFLIRQLELKEGDLIFDQCCGVGSLSLTLARKGMQICGNDLCAAYIDKARTKAAASRLPCEYYVADSKSFVPSRLCIAAINRYTSFGYADDATNQSFLDRLNDSLIPGGRVALDFFNAHWLTKNFQPILFQQYASAGGNILIRRESEIDLVRQKMHQTWTFSMPDKSTKVNRTSICLYTPEEIVIMIQKSGFHEIRLYGDEKGHDLSNDQPRCIVFARKLEKD